MDMNRNIHRIVRPSAGIAILLLATLAAGCGKGRSRMPVPAPAPAHTQLEGLASWYGQEYHGRLTASGEPFDMHDYTAAHRTLPFGTIVRVENLRNHRKVVVRINDRGPHVPGRIIDLSWQAAKKLDMLQDGVVPVRLSILNP